MKTLQLFLLAALTVFFVLPACAQSAVPEFMTPRDLIQNDSSSNISLQNNRATAATAYGLYVRQYAYVTPGSSCATATTIYSSNITAGSVVMPITLKAGERAAIGKNYLYNMIFEAIYYENIIIPSSPPGCALPGCTWGTDSTTYHWCINIGALGPVATSPGYTANIPPSADSASSGSYNYNLISSYVTLGPLACDDQTLTCTDVNQQIQPFS